MICASRAKPVSRPALYRPSIPMCAIRTDICHFMCCVGLITIPGYLLPIIRDKPRIETCNRLIAQADTDDDPTTNCAPCPVGTMAEDRGARSCTECLTGFYDDDAAQVLSAASKCVKCAWGSYSPNRSSTCTSCEPGFSDHDQDASTPCEACSNGTFAAAKATSCAACVRGTADTDLNPATACSVCEVGQYSPSSSTECVNCTVGTADVDVDAGTPCVPCPSGTYAPTKARTCESRGVSSQFKVLE